jgi:outer membrane protein assembly factor BamB
MRCVPCAIVARVRAHAEPMPPSLAPVATAPFRPLVLALVACVMLAAPHATSAQPGMPHPAGDEDHVPVARPRVARPVPTPPSTQLDVEHRLSLGAPPVAQAAIEGSIGYIALRDGRFVSVDLSTARVRWSMTLAAAAAPVAGDGLVFVPQADGVAALSADGSTRWRLSVPSGLSAPLLWRGGWLIAAASEGNVLGVRASDGQVVWTARVTAKVRGRPALTADHVYLPLEDGRVVAHELATGALVWERTLGGAPGPPLALDDRVFVGAADKFFYCLDAANGKQRWRWRMGGGIVGEPVLDSRHVYFVALDNVLRALDRWNGSQRWKQGLLLRPTGAPLLAASILYVAGVAAELQAFRADTGAPAGKFEAPAELAAPPQLIPSSSDLLSAIVLMTRVGDLQILRRRLEPAIVPLDYPLGVPVPLEPPPAPTS